MKNIIKNISIVVVAIILLSSCKKEDSVNPVTVVTDTTKTQKDMFNYYGLFLTSRNVNNLGDDRICDTDFSVIAYDITNDSIFIKDRLTSTGVYSDLLKTSYTPTVVGDTVEIWYNNALIYQIRQGSIPYDLIVREFYATNSSGLIWVDHYCKKQ